MLFVVGTPIGNLSDISLRALEVLKDVDYILAEDTRVTVKLLNKYDIKCKLKSYHEHNKNKVTKSVIEDLKAGMKIALVSDAGMPLVSDPGDMLIKSCLETGIGITTIPGPTALISALVLSGFSSREFVFYGFLPSKKKERQQKIEELIREEKTIVIYESPHRIKSFIKELWAALGDDRKVAIARELTKIHEECLIRTLSEWRAVLEDNPLKGELVVVIEGAKEEVTEGDEELMRLINPKMHLAYYMKKGFSKNEAIKLVAKDRREDRRAIYNLFTQEQ